MPHECKALKDEPSTSSDVNEGKAESSEVVSKSLHCGLRYSNEREGES